MFLPPAVSRLAYRADDLLRSRGVWSQYERLLDSERFTIEALRSLQLSKLRRMLAHAAGSSPYYGTLFSGRAFSADGIGSLEDLRRLPVLTRDIARTNGLDIRTRDPKVGALLPNSTGGSTGSNLHFWVDRECWRHRDATSLWMWRFLGLEPGQSMVSVWGSPMDNSRSQVWRSRLRRFMDNRRLVSAYRLSDRDIQEIATYVMRVRPAVLHGYPSVLDLLATRIRTGAVSWKPIPDLVVVSAAETLYAEQRRNIAETMGARVFNLYGCREFGMIAMECPYGRLHVMEHRVVLEAIPEPESGVMRVTITDLDNRGFPFIRYDIGDYCDVAPEGCPCGRAHLGLTAIRGRTMDVVRGPSGRAVGGTFWSLLLRTAVSGVETWQVVQIERSLIEIRTTPKAGLSDASKRRVAQEVRRALGDDMTVTFRGEDVLEAMPSGKHRFVVALHDRPDGGTLA